MSISYPIICPGCLGAGEIKNPKPTTNATITCPACKGSGSVTVTTDNAPCLKYDPKKKHPLDKEGTWTWDNGKNVCDSEHINFVDKDTKTIKE